jgi:hypothetical protein
MKKAQYFIGIDLHKTMVHASYRDGRAGRETHDYRARR